MERAVESPGSPGGLRGAAACDSGLERAAEHLQVGREVGTSQAGGQVGKAWPGGVRVERAAGAWSPLRGPCWFLSREMRGREVLVPEGGPLPIPPGQAMRRPCGQKGGDTTARVASLAREHIQRAATLERASGAPVPRAGGALRPQIHADLQVVRPPGGSWRSHWVFRAEPVATSSPRLGFGPFLQSPAPQIHSLEEV